MSATVHIGSPAQFNQIVSTSHTVIVDFYADWCGPCKTIAPIYEQLSSRLSRPNKITFTKVNVDHQQQIARSFNITAMPTFLILKSNRESKRIQGANPKALQDAVQALAREADSIDNSVDGASSSASDAIWLGADIPRGYSDVTDQVDVRGLDMLNYDIANGNARTLFDTSKPKVLSSESAANKKDWVESDTDEQLMIFVPFTSTLKVQALQITSGAEAASSDLMRPKTIRVFQNTHNNIGFDEAEGLEPTQEVVLKPSDWDAKTKTAKAELRFVKFQKCSSLVVFMVDGEGSGDKCRVDRLRVIGEAGEKKAMGKLEKVGEDS